METPEIKIDKDFLLNKSKVFCMAPWVHLHTSPIGNAYSCCIAKNPVGNTRVESIKDLVNSEGAKKLRLDMLNERKNVNCQDCHFHEEQGIPSFRNQFASRFNKDFDEFVTNTNADGSVKEFKMKYFDMRFSNICNFKCRTCNAQFSTQWEQEDKKRKLPYAKIYPKNNEPKFIEELLECSNQIEIAYFAGGEPLLTEEHFLLLETFIKNNKTNVKLVYNTNISSLKFKDKDILDLWSKFDHQVELWASLDHYGERAEYIRHGTNWGDIESNMLTLKQQDFIQFHINTVVSAFNYVTLADIFEYFKNKKIGIDYRNHFMHLYPMVTPAHLTSKILPKDIKKIGTDKTKRLIKIFKAFNTPEHLISRFENPVKWAESEDHWPFYKDLFQQEVIALDKARGEDFKKIFPELAPILDRTK